MARIKNGPYGPIVGRIGNTVGYIRLGQPVLRMTAHKSNKPRTIKQLGAQEIFSVVNSFIKVVNRFTNAGFKVKSKKFVGKTAQNMAMSANLNQGVEGEYPDYRLNYPKIFLSEGKLPLPASIAAGLDGGDLKFTWINEAPMENDMPMDQAMLLAYFPETGRASFTISGARRSREEDTLDLFIPVKIG